MYKYIILYENVPMNAIKLIFLRKDDIRFYENAYILSQYFYARMT